MGDDVFLKQLGYYGFINVYQKVVRNPEHRLEREGLFVVRVRVGGDQGSCEVRIDFEENKESVFPELKRRILEVQGQLNKLNPLLDSWILNWPV